MQGAEGGLCSARCTVRHAWQLPLACNNNGRGVVPPPCLPAFLPLLRAPAGPHRARAPRRRARPPRAAAAREGGARARRPRACREVSLGLAWWGCCRTSDTSVPQPSCSAAALRQPNLPIAPSAVCSSTRPRAHPPTHPPTRAKAERAERKAALEAAEAEREAEIDEDEEAARAADWDEVSARTAC